MEQITISDESIKTEDLEFVDAYNMYFSNNKWFFTVNSYAKSRIQDTGIYKIGITVTKSGQTTSTPSTATCLLYDGIGYTSFVKFLCYCDYKEQSKDDLVQIQYGDIEGHIKWTKGLTTDYKITLNTILTIKNANALIKKNNYWTFKVEIDKKDDTILPMNSKVVVDVSDNDYLANCTYQGENILDCVSNCRGTNGPFLVYYKTFKSSVVWTNDDLSMYSILREATVDLLSLNYLYYEDSKWHFSISTFLGYSKAIVGIVYNGAASTATCMGKTSHEMICDVNKETQTNVDRVLLASAKSTESTVTWTNIKKNMQIPLRTELTLVKVYNLHINGGWIFNVDISDDGIPNDALLIVDIKLLKSYPNGGTKTLYSIANCIHNSKKLECSVVIERTDDNPNIYSPSLLLTKRPNSISTVTKWNLASSSINDVATIPQTASLAFYYANKTYTEDGKTYFNTVPEGAYFVIDILIDSVKSVSNCVATSKVTLKCQITEDIADKKVYVAKDKVANSDSTVAWTNLKVNQFLFSTTLKFIHAHNFKMYNPTLHYRFTMIVEGDSDNLKNDIIYPVKLHLKVNDRVKSNVYDKIHMAQCLNNNGFLSCDVARVFPERDTYYLELTASDDTVHWSNPGQINIDETGTYLSTFLKLYTCEYDATNKYYIYSIELQNSIPFTDENTVMVMDLKINSADSYGLCSFKSSRVIECKTPVMTQSITDIIIIVDKGNNRMGNMEWRGISGSLQIYPSNYVVADVSKIYDLEFNSNKWQFQILTENTLNFENTKNLKIKVSDSEGDAICTLDASNNKHLSCEVGQVSQNSNQLITLIREYQENTEYIRLASLFFDGIPFTATLKFVSSLGMKYSENENYKGWSFTLNVEKSESLTIPSGSTFSVDITYGTSNTPELAFCTENSRSGNTLSLTCKPQKEISKSSLIKLASTKTTYASITWSPAISGDDTYIYQDLNLNVNYVTVPEFATNSYKFNMYINGNDLPSGTKAKVDINFNGNTVLASCDLNTASSGNYYFECSFPASAKADTDTYSIKTTKVNGNVNFINSENNLKFIYTLFFNKASGLTFASNKCSFNIELSESSLPNGNSIDIDITINGQSKTATCTLGGNTLHCIKEETGLAITDVIKIVNKNNDKFAWKDLPSETELRLAYTITRLDGSYGGYSDGKWKFYLYHTSSDNSIPNGIKVYLDILYNNNPDKADCEIESPFLKCEYSSNVKTYEKIRISKNAPNLGTVTFSPSLANDQEIEPAKFTLKYESKESSYNNGKLTFKLKGKLGQTLNYKIYENSYTEVGIFSYQADKEFERTTLIAPCLTNEIATTAESNVQVTCEIQIANNLNVKLNIDSNKMFGALKIETDEQDIELKAAGSDTQSNNGNYLLINNLLLLVLVLLI